MKKEEPAPSQDTKDPSNPPLDLKINDYVIYPLHGIGILTDIYQNKDNEKLYKIKLKESDMSISLPIRSVDEAGVRKIITHDDISRIIDNFSQRPAIPEDNWRVRFQENIKKLKSGNVESSITLIKQLFLRNKRKTLSTIERKQFESAFDMLIKEISIVSNTDEEQVTSLLSSKLDELYGKETEATLVENNKDTRPTKLPNDLPKT